MTAAIVRFPLRFSRAIWITRRLSFRDYLGAALLAEALAMKPRGRA
jgi:hypothetical protein